ncbi:hypothetical protein EYC84_007536 [Monilinia fructicola]|uniref:Uncharacterized protein n=1 Tax=Monilinia fructicola TaxID=38448 RepID=A0A5M9JGV4_MONFR|nr:hypothetical protein EYC84_007536 [Monilinia fructicola]
MAVVAFRYLALQGSGSKPTTSTGIRHWGRYPEFHVHPPPISISFTLNKHQHRHLCVQLLEPFLYAL